MKVYRSLLGLLVVVCTSLAVAETRLAPPVAPRVEHREVRHGEAVEDDYYWLREKSNPAVIEYLDAENAYTKAMTERQMALEETLYQEMLGRVKQTDLTVPTRRDGFDYYARTEEGKQYPVQCRRKVGADAAEEVLLDLNELAAGHDFFAQGVFVVSDDGNLLAYTTDTTGFRQYVLHVKDLRSGQTLADTAERVTSLQWAADNKTLLYTVEHPVTKRAHQFWRHVIGNTHSELVHDEKDELFDVRTRRTSDRKFVLLQIGSSDASEFRFLPTDQPAGELRVLQAREPKHRYRVDHRDGLFYIVTNKNAQNFRVVTAPDADPGERNWTEFLPHRADVLVQNIELFKNFAAVLERSNALNQIRIFDFRSQAWHAINFREPVYSAVAINEEELEDFYEPVYAVFPMADREFDEPICRYAYQSLVTPPSIFDYDMEKRVPVLLKQQEVLGGYDAAKYTSGRSWATARDGTRVPLSIVHKKGLKRDGSAPLLLYGYGSYGMGLPATFSSERISLLDRGVVFAVAHIRGGNEMGDAWREAGMLMNKKNTFNDFVDCAEFLVKEKWTSSDRLIIEGFSAGGLLMGAVVNQRPELFRAVHAGVPFVDVMNTMLDPSLPLTVGEYLVWGNPQQKDAYDYMRSYSPYDNLTRRAYPAMLVTGSLNDSQVMYWEPAKYVARLRTLKTDDNPLLLKTNMGGGHGGASGRYDRLRDDAFRYAWMLNQVGIQQ